MRLALSSRSGSSSVRSGITSVFFILSVALRPGSAQLQPTNSSDDAFSPEADVEYGELGERGAVPSNWGEWDMDQKIAYFSGKTAETVDKIVKEDIPALERAAEKAKKLTPNVDIDIRIEQLKKLTPQLEEVSKEIKEGKYKDKFKATYVEKTVGGKTVEEVKIHKDINNEVSKLVDRSTPLAQQWATRGLAGMQAIHGGLGKLTKNWDDPEKAFENMADMFTMFSGVLAVIPSPFTQGLSVFLEFGSMLFGIFVPAAEDKISKDIRNAVDLLVNKYDKDKKIQSDANKLDVDKYWHFAFIILDNKNITNKQWSTYRENDDVPTIHHFKHIDVLQGYVRENLLSGDSASQTTDMFKNWWRQVQRLEELYTRLIHTMPHDEESGLDDTQRGFIYDRKQVLRSSVQFLNAYVVNFTKNSVGALKDFYPPARDVVANHEFFSFLNGITYEKTNGKVYGADNFPDPPTGTYYIEPAAERGHYLRSASDWNEDNQYYQKYREYVDFSYEKGVRLIEIHERLKLGTTITLTWPKSSKRGPTRITIEEPDDVPFPGARTLTFDDDGGTITFLTQFTFQKDKFNLPERRYWKKHYTRGGTPIFTESSKFSHERNAGITVNKFFRIIPLKKEAGDPGIPVLIGEAEGDNFLTINDDGFAKTHYKYPMYLKPFKEETVGSGATQKKQVDKKQIFYLIK